jgi:chromosomal replication initiation ATPase DnaA
MPTAAIVHAVAAHFGAPPDGLAEQRDGKRRRSTAALIVLYLAKTLGQNSAAQVTREFHVAGNAVRDAVHKVTRRREVDPELARTIAEIEAELGAG